MKNNKKKILSAIVCGIMFFLASCGSDGKGNEVAIPDYDSKKDSLELRITSWYSPEMTNISIEDYKLAGFNHIILLGNSVGGFTSSTMLAAVKKCQENKLYAYVSTMNGLDGLISKGADYSEYSYVNGVNVYDEPLINSGLNSLGNPTLGIYDLANYIPDFEKAYGNRDFYVNMNPLGALNLGGSYTEYIDACCNQLLAKTTHGERWLSADSYVLKNSGAGSSTYFLKEEWLQNLAMLQRAKYLTHKELNLKTNFFIQAMPIGTTNDRIPTYNDLSLQIYSMLAYGYDSVAYFCYQTPPVNFEFGSDQYALLDRSGKKTSVYDAAKKINNEINQFDHVYLQFNKNWIGVVPIIGTKNTKGENNSFSLLKDYCADTTFSVKAVKELKSVTAEYDTLIGYMKDDFGNPGFMLVNYNDTAKQCKGKVELEFNGAKKALVYRNGKGSLEDVTDNKISLNLGIGEGIFVIPFAK